MMNMNIACLIYEGLARPGDRVYINRLEMLNEWFVNTTTFFLLFFTDWIGDYELQFKLGWAVIGFISL